MILAFPASADTLPAAYDLRDIGAVTPVEHQGGYGTCWAFGTLHPMESNSILKGYETNTSINLSERHLLYFFSHRENVTAGIVNPKLAGLAGDTMSYLNVSYLDAGGYAELAVLQLALGIGPVDDSLAPYAALSPMNPQPVETLPGLPAELAVGQSRYHLSSAVMPIDGTRDEIKHLLLEHGAGSISYYACPPEEEKEYMNVSVYRQNPSTCYYQTNSTVEPNHAVTLAGWDDNYPKENFKTQPGNDGAWLIKNSWGTEYFDEGYLWISYEEPSLESFIFYDVVPAGWYDSCYQYDGTASFFGVAAPETGSRTAVLTTYALNTDATGKEHLREVLQRLDESRENTSVVEAKNVFTAAGDEDITHASFVTFNSNTEYRITVSVNNHAAETLTGYLRHPGYYTAELPKSVRVETGDNFAVSLRLSVNPADTVNLATDDQTLQMPADAITVVDETIVCSAVSERRQSWFFDGTEFVDAYSLYAENTGSMNFRIKAFGEVR